MSAPTVFATRRPPSAISPVLRGQSTHQIRCATTINLDVDRASLLADDRPGAAARNGRDRVGQRSQCIAGLPDRDSHEVT